MKPIDSSDAELAAFDRVCERLSGFDGSLDAEWIDGYLTALAAGPRRVDIDEWLPKLTGDAFERAFADPDDVAQARAALLARVRVIANHLDPEALLDAPDELRLQPLVAIWDDAARRSLVDEGVESAADAGQFVTGGRWGAAFLTATEDYAGDWHWRDEDVDEDDGDAFNELMDHVKALIHIGDDWLTAHVERWYPNQEPTREDLIDEACFAIQDLRVWWLDHAPRPPTRRVEPTPGRNDPCPCGSGKKYKRCHGAA